MEIKITFMLGNGFDVGMKLPTKYKDFYELYKPFLSGEGLEISYLKSRIQEDLNYDYWSDFEEAIGKFDFKQSRGNQSTSTESYKTPTPKNSPQNYVSVFKNFREAFRTRMEAIDEVLEDITGKPSFPKDDLGKKIYKGITDFYNHPSIYHCIEGDQRAFQEFRFLACKANQYDYNFVTFNYSSACRICVDALKDYISSKSISNVKINDPVYLHGTVKEGMIMGVNDSTQIKNIFFRMNPTVRKAFIKRTQISDGGRNADREVENVIQNSDVICLYGCSVGVTDNRWWKTISRWLAEDPHRLLFILTYDPRDNALTYNSECQAYKNNYLKKFRKCVRDRIFIGVNHNIFAYPLFNKAPPSYNPNPK